MGAGTEGGDSGRWTSDAGGCDGITSTTARTECPPHLGGTNAARIHQPASNPAQNTRIIKIRLFFITGAAFVIDAVEIHIICGGVGWRGQGQCGDCGGHLRCCGVHVMCTPCPNFKRYVLPTGIGGFWLPVSFVRLNPRRAGTEGSTATGVKTPPGKNSFPCRHHHCTKRRFTPASVFFYGATGRLREEVINQVVGGKGVERGKKSRQDNACAALETLDGSPSRPREKAHGRTPRRGVPAFTF